MTEIVLAPVAGDGTAHIQGALDAAAGGGRVRLGPGRHHASHLRLSDGTTFHIDAGAELWLTGRYDALADNSVSVLAERSDRALIVAQGARDIAIAGAGTIVAPGPDYVLGDDPDAGTLVPAALRPRVLVLEDCAGVRIADITVRQSPMWTLHLVGCTDVVISGVTIANDRRLPNTDGIVIDSCSDVEIVDTEIATADDGICLKTSRRGDRIGEAARIAVRRCVVSSLSCALKIGTESFGDITDVLFADCRIEASNRGLGIFSRDGGMVSRVTFERITLACAETPDGYWGSGEPLTITVLDRVADRPAGAVSDVVVRGLTGRAEGAICLVSESSGGIARVALEQVHLQQLPGALGTALRYDLRPTPADLTVVGGLKGRANAWQKDATGQIVGLRPYPCGLPGLFAAGVSGLTLSDVTIDRPQTLPAGWNAETFVVRP